MTFLQDFRRYTLAFVFAFSLVYGYTWPLPGSQRLTSSFGEYRAGHFHAGIDFSTPSGTGMRILAPHDGDVVRISIQPWGYGLAVYLQDRDGLVSVFAHLSSFSDEVMARVEAEQLRTRKYSHDLWFQAGEFPISEGQLLARSGDTGAGSAHLHFETRRGMSRAINPFHFGFTVEDAMAPLFQGFMVIPNDRNSSAWHRSSSNIYGYLQIEPRQISTGNYAIDDTVYISSSAGFAIRAFDYQNPGNLNRLGFYKAHLYENDALHYYAVYDSFEYADTRLLGHTFDLNVENWGFSRYHRLFSRPWTVNAYPFMYNSPHSGIFTMRAGEVRNFRVVISDFYGNSSTLRFVAKGIAPRPSIDLKLGLYDWGGAIFYPPGIPRGSLDVKLNKGSRYETVDLGEGEDYISFRARPGDIARLEYREAGRLSRYYYFRIPEMSRFVESGQKTIESKLAADDNFLFITMTCKDFLGYPMSISSNYNVDYMLHNPDPKTLLMRLPLNDLNPGEFLIKFAFHDGREHDVNFTSFDISGKGGSFRSGEIAFEIPEGGTFAPSRRLIMRKNENNYEIHPSGLLLKRNATVWLEITDPSLPRDKVCLVRKWAGREYYIDNTVKTQAGRSFVTGTARTPGFFATSVDTTPPVVSNIHFGSTKIRFDIKDNLSGFSRDNLPDVYINGEWVISRYAPDKDRCYVRIPGNLPHGNHRLRIVATDNVGNRTEVERSFSR